MPRMRLADSGAPVLAWVVLPRSVFASSQTSIRNHALHSKDRHFWFLSDRQVPFPPSKYTSFLIQKCRSVPKEQLVILMPQGCSCCVYRTMLPPPNPPTPQSDYVQGEPSWPTSPVCCGEWIVTNSVSHPPAEVHLQTDVDLSVSL